MNVNLNSICLFIILLLPIKFEISLRSPNIKKASDLEVHMEFSSLEKKYFLIPKHFDYKFSKLNNSDSLTMSWVVQRIEDKLTKEIKPIETDQFGLFFPVNERWDTVCVNKSLKKKFPLDAFYNLEPGKYRTKANFWVTDLLGKRQQVSSNWLEFQVDNMY